jgi:hypothetical protein
MGRENAQRIPYYDIMPKKVFENPAVGSFTEH